MESDYPPLVRISKKTLTELTPRLQQMKMRVQHSQYISIPSNMFLVRKCTYQTICHDFVKQTLAQLT